MRRTFQNYLREFIYAEIPGSPICHAYILLHHTFFSDLQILLSIEANWEADAPQIKKIIVQLAQTIIRVRVDRRDIIWSWDLYKELCILLGHVQQNPNNICFLLRYSELSNIVGRPLNYLSAEVLFELFRKTYYHLPPTIRIESLLYTCFHREWEIEGCVFVGKDPISNQFGADLNNIFNNYSK